MTKKDKERNECGLQTLNDHQFVSAFLSDYARGYFPVNLFILTLQFVELDGCSLSTETLVALGNGEFKIKVC